MAKSRRAPKGIERVVRYAEAHHWTVQRTRGGHIKLTKPGCAPIFTSHTPSDRRAERNALSQLRRAQLQREGQGGHS